MVAGITVKNVPPACTKQDLQKHFKSRRHGGGTIDYVLYPLFENQGEAFVAFQDSKVAANASTHRHVLHKQTLEVSLAPKQMLTLCIVDVDRWVVENLPDVGAFVKTLETDWGVRAVDASDTGHLTIGGALVQIQCVVSQLNDLLTEQPPRTPKTNCGIMGNRESQVEDLKSETIPKETAFPKAEVGTVVDPFIMDYAKKFFLDDIRALEQKYRVTYEFDQQDEVALVYILPVGGEGEHSPQHIWKAKEQFCRFYHSVFKQVKMKTVTCGDSDTISPPDATEKTVFETRNMFKCLFVIENPAGEITLVGKPKCVALATDWLARKFSVALSSGSASTGNLNVLRMVLSLDTEKHVLSVACCDTAKRLISGRTVSILDDLGNVIPESSTDVTDGSPRDSVTDGNRRDTVTDGNRSDTVTDGNPRDMETDASPCDIEGVTDGNPRDIEDVTDDNPRDTDDVPPDSDGNVTTTPDVHDNTNTLQLDNDDNDASFDTFIRYDTGDVMNAPGETDNHDDSNEHKGTPYCHVPCYSALFGPSMFGHGSSVDAHTNFGDQPKEQEDADTTRADLEAKLKVYNTYHEGKTFQIKSKEVNGRLVLEGPLRVNWGVQCPIQFKKKDDESRTTETPKHWRKSYKLAINYGLEGQELQFDQLSPPSVTGSLTDLSPDSRPSGTSLRRHHTVALRRERKPRRHDKRRLSMINGHIYDVDTSIFIPAHGSVTSVTISSIDTAPDVITRLLDKFKVENNPEDFCLCKMMSTGETRMLQEADHPLMERVISGPLEDNAKIFIMDKDKVNEVTHEMAQFINLPDAMLDAFLQKYRDEEAAAIMDNRKKYARYRFLIQQALDKLSART